MPRNPITWVLIALCVVTLPGLLIFSSMGVAYAGISDNPDAVSEVAVFLVPMWGLWFGGVVLTVWSHRWWKRPRLDR